MCLATNSLKKHAETKLKPSCSPSNLHLCDDAKKAEVLVCAPTRVCACMSECGLAFWAASWPLLR